MIEIELDMIPVPWSASRVGKKGHFNPRGKDKTWTQWMVKQQYREEPLEGFIVLDIKFIEPVPASVGKNAREAIKTGEIRPARCDLTNCIKFIEDCLKNIVFMDDRYVCKNISEKLYGDKGKILIKVYTLPEYRDLYENNIGAS